MRMMGAVAGVALLLAGGGVAAAVEPAEGAAPSDVERRLDEVLALLEAQRREIDDLRARLAADRPDEGGLAAAVRAYLESEEGRKVLGRGKDDFRAFWKDGLNFQTADGRHSLRVGGRVQYDVIFPRADSDVTAAVGAPWVRTNQFRRARLQMSGTLYGNVYFGFQVEFATTPHQFREMFLGVKDVPLLGRVQVGRMKEPFSLEELTSANTMAFMERSTMNPLARSFRTGVLAQDSLLDGRAGWQAGLFGDDDTRGTGVVGNNLVARVYGAPVYADEGRTLLHLGAAYDRRDPEGSVDRLSARPGISIGGRPVDTGLFSVETSETAGLEAAAVLGSVSLQGEWAFDRVDGHTAGAPNPVFHGWYVQGSWFLTGEHRPWKDGVFGRVKPKSDFGGGGTGAWELAMRVAEIDLQDGGISGGGQRVVDLGVNWYLNPNTRVMVGYTMAHVEGLGRVNTLAMRVQIDF